MILKCDSDSTAFILHCTFTSVFCLRHECRKLKATVLMILAISDMMAALCRKFAYVVFQNGMRSDFTCLCRHPQMLLQIGASFLNLALIAINAKVSKKSQVTGCQSYTHLVLFNGLSFMLAASATNVASGVLYNAGETLAAEYTQGVTFLMSMYRIIFLSLDSLYYACTEEEDDEQDAFRDKQGPGKHITIQM